MLEAKREWARLTGVIVGRGVLYGAQPAPAGVTANREFDPQIVIDACLTCPFEECAHDNNRGCSRLTKMGVSRTNGIKEG